MFDLPECALAKYTLRLINIYLNVVVLNVSRKSCRNDKLYRY